jgi:hypothetical protein
MVKKFSSSESSEEPGKITDDDPAPASIVGGVVAPAPSKG